MAFVTYYEPYNLPYVDEVFSDLMIKGKRLSLDDLMTTHCDVMITDIPVNLSILKDHPSHIICLTPDLTFRRYHMTNLSWRDEYHNIHRSVRLWSLSEVSPQLSIPKARRQTLEKRLARCPKVPDSDTIPISDMYTRKGNLYGVHDKITYQIYEVVHDHAVVYTCTPIALYDMRTNLFWTIRPCEIYALKGYGDTVGSTGGSSGEPLVPTKAFMTSLVTQLYITQQVLIRDDVVIPATLLTETFQGDLYNHITSLYLRVCLNNSVGLIYEVTGIAFTDYIYVSKADGTTRCKMGFTARCLKANLFRYYTGSIRFCVPNIGMVLNVPEFSTHDFRCQFLIKADVSTYDTTTSSLVYPCGCEFKVGSQVTIDPQYIEYDNLKKVYNCQGVHVCPPP